MDFFQGTQRRVRNSRGKRAISVRAIEVLLYLYLCFDSISIIIIVDVLPSLVADTSLCEHCNAVDQGENSPSFTRGHKRNSSSHLYVKGAKNPMENCTPEILQTQNVNNCDAVDGVDTSIKQDVNPRSTGYGGSCPDKCGPQADKVASEDVKESQIKNPQITVSNFDIDNKGNNKSSSKLKSKSPEPKISSNMKVDVLDNDGYECVDSRLDSLDDNLCVIYESLSDTVGNNRTEGGFDFVDLKLQSLEDNTRVINDLNMDLNENDKRKHQKAGTHVGSTYVVKQLLDNKNSKNVLASVGKDCKDERNKAGMNDFTNNINVDDDTANNNVRNRSPAQYHDNDTRDKRYRTNNTKTDHTRPNTKCKPGVEIPTDIKDIQNSNDTDRFPRKRKPTINEKGCVKDVKHEKTQPDTYVRLQEAIQRSFTKFLYEIDLMEFSDSLYEQFVLDMNTYECLFEMWQLDKSKLDAKRKLLLFLSRGQVNKEHFEKAIWKSSHYPLLDAFFPKT